MFTITVDDLEKRLKAVTPAKAGVQKCFKTLDPGLRRDAKKRIPTV